MQLSLIRSDWKQGCEQLGNLSLPTGSLPATLKGVTAGETAQI